MIDELLNFYRDLWNGDKANMHIPKRVNWFGYINEIKNPEQFYHRYGTLEGIREQYKGFNMTCGIIYHLIPETNEMGKYAWEKSKEQIKLDGHYENI